MGKRNRTPIRDELIDLTTPRGIKKYLDEHPRAMGMMVSREVLEELLDAWAELEHPEVSPC